MSTKSTRSHLSVKRAGAPVSQSTTISRGAHQQATGSLKDGKFTLRHTEFVNSISVSPVDSQWRLIGETTAQPGYDLNPANELLFPWLSTQALDYEMYRFTSLRFHLFPKQATSANGWIAMSFDYDWDDELSSSKREMLTCLSLVEGSCYKELTLNIDTDYLNKVVPYRYIQTPSQGGQERRMINAGYLELALDAATPGQNYGWDLWVSYVVELSVPRYGREATGTVSSDPLLGVAESSTKTVFSIPVPDSVGSWGTVEKITEFFGPATGLAYPPGYLNSLGTKLPSMLKVIQTDLTKLKSAYHLMKCVSQVSGTIPNGIGEPSYWCWDSLGSFLGTLDAADSSSTVRSGSGIWSYLDFTASTLFPTFASGIKYILPTVQVVGTGLLGVGLPAVTRYLNFLGDQKSRQSSSSSVRRVEGMSSSSGSSTC